MVSYMKTITAPQIWEEHIVPQIHKKFVVEVPSVWKFEQLIRRAGGEIHLDHGATRTVEPEVHAFITRLAEALGLVISGSYDFPNKKLKAVALQSPGKEGFKWFSTLIEREKFSPKAIEVIEDDIKRTSNKLSGVGLQVLEKLEKDKSLTENEAVIFADEIVWTFLERQGPPVKKSTIDILSKESSEIVNALLLGLNFNHIGYDMDKLFIRSWYGQEIIEVMNDRMLLAGFEMLPEIQGQRGGLLRQTSTKADSKEFQVEEEDGSRTTISSPYKFIELIQRGSERDENGRIKFDEKGRVLRFRGFLSGNTEKLYDATNIKR